MVEKAGTNPMITQAEHDRRIENTKVQLKKELQGLRNNIDKIIKEDNPSDRVILLLNGMYDMVSRERYE